LKENWSASIKDAKMKYKERRMIEVRNLSVSVEGKKILDNVNLHIGQGETIVLVGPNGCGQTSLLNTIMGIPQYRV